MSHPALQSSATASRTDNPVREPGKLSSAVTVTLATTLAVASLPAHAMTASQAFSATGGGTATPIYDAYQISSSTSSANAFNYEPLSGASFSNGAESFVTYTGYSPQYTQVFEGYGFDSNTDAYDIPQYGSQLIGYEDYWNTTTYQPSAVGTSPTATGDLTKDGVVVFTGATNNFSSQTFQSAFLGGTSYTEGEVVKEIASGFTDTNALDQAAYNTFLGTLTSSYASGPGTAATAYLFSNGQNVGAIASASLSPAGQSYGFGLAPEAMAAPEPSQYTIWAGLGLGLGGLFLRRKQRRTVTE